MLMFCKGQPLMFILSCVVEHNIAAGQLQILLPVKSYCCIVPLSYRTHLYGKILHSYGVTVKTGGAAASLVPLLLPMDESGVHHFRPAIVRTQHMVKVIAYFINPIFMTK